MSGIDRISSGNDYGVMSMIINAFSKAANAVRDILAQGLKDRDEIQKKVDVKVEEKLQNAKKRLNQIIAVFKQNPAEAANQMKELKADCQGLENLLPNLTSALDELDGVIGKKLNLHGKMQEVASDISNSVMEGMQKLVDGLF